MSREDEIDGNIKRRRRRAPNARKSPALSSLQVAKLAGVSRSAVSRAFTPGASVSAETRARIVAAAAAIGYRPNAIARSMITRRTNIVGLVLGDMVNPFYAEALEALSRGFQAEGRHLLLFTLLPQQRLDDVITDLLQYQVDAVVVASATITSGIVERCAEQGASVILFNRTIPGTLAHTVCLDNEAAGRMAADLLIGAGRRKLWFVAGHADTSTGIDRERGFFDEAARRGIADILRLDGGYSYEGARRAVTDALAQKSPDAIFGANDLLAIGALDAVRDAGRRVPTDVAIVGCDDIAVASWKGFDLTTFRTPIDQMVRALVSVTVETIERRGSGTMSYIVPPVLVARGSA